MINDILSLLPAILLIVSFAYSLVTCYSVYKKRRWISPGYVIITTSLSIIALMLVLIPGLIEDPCPNRVTILVLSIIMVIDSLGVAFIYYFGYPKLRRDTKAISVKHIGKDFFNSLADEELRHLSDVFHEYKDYNRGNKEALLKTMSLEAKMTFCSAGRYESDCTYNVKDITYKPEDFLDVAEEDLYEDLDMTKEQKEATVIALAKFATEFQLDKETVRSMCCIDSDAMYNILSKY